MKKAILLAVLCFVGTTVYAQDEVKTADKAKEKVTALKKTLEEKRILLTKTEQEITDLEASVEKAEKYAKKMARIAEVAQTKVPTNNTAVLVVIMPDEDAKLWFDGIESKNAGEQYRTFKTPALQPGMSYYYDLKCKASNGYTQMRRVQISGNQVVRIDFR